MVSFSVLSIEILTQKTFPCNDVGGSKTINDDDLTAETLVKYG